MRLNDLALPLQNALMDHKIPYLVQVFTGPPDSEYQGIEVMHNYDQRGSFTLTSRTSETIIVSIYHPNCSPDDPSLGFSETEWFTDGDAAIAWFVERALELRKQEGGAGASPESGFESRYASTPTDSIPHPTEDL